MNRNEEKGHYEFLEDSGKESFCIGPIKYIKTNSHSKFKKEVIEELDKITGYCETPIPKPPKIPPKQDPSKTKKMMEVRNEAKRLKIKIDKRLSQEKARKEKKTQAKNIQNKIKEDKKREQDLLRKPKVEKRILRREAKDKGLCQICYILPYTISTKSNLLCDICWAKNISKNTLGDEGNFQTVLNVWKSSGEVCKYTGEKLIRGKNVSLDHIVPKSKGGSNNYDNLQFVLTSVNMMKFSLDEDYFLEMCRKISK